MGGAPSLDAVSLRRLAVEVFVISSVVLFQELALIRWLPSQVRVLAYFPNLILLSAFLGLGMGSLRASEAGDDEGPSTPWLWPVSLLALVAAVAVMSRVIFTEEAGTPHLWLLYQDLPRDSPVIQGVRLPLLVTFVLSAWTFLPLGRLLAERLEAFRRRTSALWGYSWDILGSLAGVVLFTLLGFWGAFPVVWFALFLLAGLAFFRGSPRRWLPYLAVAAVLTFSVGLIERNEAYSPYYALRGDDVPRGFQVLANGAFHQLGVAMGRASPVRDEWHASVRESYRVPYELLDRPPRHALVLGAGTGNDVAVLLEMGAEHVDAVEIDPQILEWGRRRHPDRPYDDPRVRTYTTDARSFLQRTDRKYDVITFGTLDSMTRLSALSNVRLDNFVYTREALEAARGHLTEDGGVVLYFAILRPYIQQRLTGLMLEVFDTFPVVYWTNRSLFTHAFMAGPAYEGFEPELRAQEGERFEKDVLPVLDVPVDDWPFLYLEGRTIGGFYWSMLLALALVSLVGVLWASPRMRSSLLRRSAWDLEMFLFGAGFLLLETRAVTALNLLWGATWITSAVVFGAILFMIYLATILTELRPLSWNVSAVGLVATLGVSSLVPVHTLLDLGSTGQLLGSVLLAGGPIFFASLCFAEVFGARGDAARAFGWNVLGAVAGGLLEFLSLVLGLRAMLWVALVVYLSILLIHERRR